MALISVSNLTFSYEGSYDNIFEDVNFQIDTDWRLGFIGRNGRGKTTFLNLLLGKYPYKGSISTDTSFEYFPYEVKEPRAPTMEIIRGICPKCMDWEIQRELSLLDVQDNVLERPFDSLSKGEQTKVLLGALFLTSNRFLLIDEPTNHLDISARALVRDYLKTKKGFILTSHDRTLLDSCVDHILSINKTNIDIQKGNFSSWWANKSLQDSFELAENVKLRKEIGRLSRSARRSSAWADKVEKSKFGTTNSGSKIDRGYVGRKSAKAMKRSKNIEARQQEAIAQKSELLHNIEQYQPLKIDPLPFHREILIRAKELAIFYGDRPIFDPIDFKIKMGDRVALRGKNGSGKSSILKLIKGEDIGYTGDLDIAKGLRLSYVSQDTSGLSGPLEDFIYDSHIDETLFKTILRKMDFSRDQFDKNMEDYSDGQKKKVLLARSLCQRAHLYIWDEPLNYIDVFSRIQIEDMLLKYSPTLLFVEHDQAFYDNISTKSISLD